MRIFKKSKSRTFRKSEPYGNIPCISQKLMVEKFEDADFKYDNSFSKLQLKNTHVRHFGPKFIQTFLVTTLKTFVFVPNLSSDKFEGVNFKYKYFFQIPAQKNPNKVFLKLILGVFISAQKINFRKIEGC